MVQQEQGGAEDAKMLIYVRTHIRDMKLQWQIATKPNVTREARAREKLGVACCTHVLYMRRPSRSRREIT